MTRSHFFALLAVCIFGGISLAADESALVESNGPDSNLVAEPYGVFTAADLEKATSTLRFTAQLQAPPASDVKPAYPGDDLTGVNVHSDSETGPNDGVVNLDGDGPYFRLSSTSGFHLNDPETEAVYSWFHGTAYASITTIEEDVDSIEALGFNLKPTVLTQSCSYFGAMLTPMTYRSKSGATVTLDPGLTPAQVVGILQPLPIDCDRLSDLEDLLRQRFQFGAMPDSRAGLRFLSGGEIIVSSRLFPEQLFCLSFDLGQIPRLIRSELLDGSYLMWLRYAHGKKDNRKGQFRFQNRDRIEFSGIDPFWSHGNLFPNLLPTD
ncbi:MAG: hypothetical protein JWM11_1997 [Planctomycetaceae bacterium]|nr:hypothetical protein [Planctomycetaceae bacterium]